MTGFAERIREKALSLGFAACGFARAGSLESLRPAYADFIRRNRQGELTYLERYAEQRLNPGLLLPGIRSVIALLMNYYPGRRIPARDNFRIAAYAYGRRYPALLKERMALLTNLLLSLDPGSRSRSYVDSGPVLEKYWAQRCGVGWQGKNTLLINPDRGSFLFIGIMFTTLELEPDKPGTDRCGSCTLCLKACPTNALHTPCQLDISRCITYHNIRIREEIPDGVKGRFSGWIFGCDSCQDACPWNRKALPHDEPHFRVLPGLMRLRKREWLAMTEEEFQRLFRHSEIRRTGLPVLKRNMAL